MGRDVNNKVIFIGGARDYHAMDWYRAVKRETKCDKIIFVTDLYAGEGYAPLANTCDKIVPLLIIDSLLPSQQTSLGHIWRNIVKLVVAPIQVMRVRALARRHPQCIWHALPLYYMFLCWMARVPYIGTPQGSEILVRPKRSQLYRHMAARCLRAASQVTVDSASMADEVERLCGRRPLVIQNGVDVFYVRRNFRHDQVRTHVVSIRGMAPLYRIAEIIRARNESIAKPKISIIYPFKDAKYHTEVQTEVRAGDTDLGRLGKDEMYAMLCKTRLVISIPASDSSPRSVYEAIFAGSCVAAVYNRWMDDLTPCMRERLWLVDLGSPCWFDDALGAAERITSVPYFPSKEAIQTFDERQTIWRASRLLYNI